MHKSEDGMVCAQSAVLSFDKALGHQIYPQWCSFVINELLSGHALLGFGPRLDHTLCRLFDCMQTNWMVKERLRHQYISETKISRERERERDTRERASSSLGIKCFSEVITAILNPLTDAGAPVAESVAEYFWSNNSNCPFSIRMERMKLKEWKLLTPVIKRAKQEKSPSDTYDSTLLAANVTRTSTPSRQEEDM